MSSTRTRAAGTVMRQAPKRSAGDRAVTIGKANRIAAGGHDGWNDQCTTAVSGALAILQRALAFLTIRADKVPGGVGGTTVTPRLRRARHAAACERSQDRADARDVQHSRNLPLYVCRSLVEDRARRTKTTARRSQMIAGDH